MTTRFLELASTDDSLIQIRHHVIHDRGGGRGVDTDAGDARHASPVAVNRIVDDMHEGPAAVGWPAGFGSPETWMPPWPPNASTLLMIETPGTPAPGLGPRLVHQSPANSGAGEPGWAKFVSASRASGSTTIPYPAASMIWLSATTTWPWVAVVLSPWSPSPLKTSIPTTPLSDRWPRRPRTDRLCPVFTPWAAVEQHRAGPGRHVEGLPGDLRDLRVLIDGAGDQGGHVAGRLCSGVVDRNVARRSASSR